MKNNKFKRLGAAVLTAMMVLSTGMTALADPTPPAAAEVKKGYLTINGTGEIPKTGATFSIYEVLTFNADKAVDNAQGDYVYTDVKVADVYKGVITDEELKNLPSYGTSNLSSSEIVKLAGKLAGVDKAPVAATYVIGQQGPVELPYGYYLILETGRGAGDTSIKSRPILVAVPQANGEGITSTSPVAVTVKSEIPNIEKEVTNGNPQVLNGQNNAYNNLQIGDSVDYKVTSAIPVYGSDVQTVTYVITDTLSSGLDFTSISLKVKVSGGNAESEMDSQIISNNVKVSGQTITIDMSSLFNDATFTVGGKTLREWGETENAQFILTYSAVINENAVVGNEGNPNSVKLEFEADHETDEKVVKTYTTSLKVIKKAEGAAEGAAVLPGAIFKLMKEENGTFVEMGEADPADPKITLPLTQTTDTNGELTFNGLAAGTYKLIETKAPAGYNKDATERVFTIALDGNVKWQESNLQDIIIENIKDGSDVETGTFQTTITNVKGLVLPGTGGIGTTIFKVAGAALVILACGMLLVYYKKKNKETK